MTTSWLTIQIENLSTLASEAGIPINFKKKRTRKIRIELNCSLVFRAKILNILNALSALLNCYAINLYIINHFCTKRILTISELQLLFINVNLC